MKNKNDVLKFLGKPKDSLVVVPGELYNYTKLSQIYLSGTINIRRIEFDINNIIIQIIKTDSSCWNPGVGVK